MSEVREFKGIWIAKEIWMDNDLTLQEKCAFAEIDSLSNLEKGCIASNDHFAKFLGVSKDRAKRVISSLVDKGYIISKIERDKETNQVTERRLFPTRGWGTLHPEGEGEKTPKPRGEIYPENNTSITNTLSNTKKDIVQKQVSAPCGSIPFVEIISYLNEKAGRRYKVSNDLTRRLIRARWNEGFRLDDFEKVINTKVAQWKGSPQMDKYLRPQTLFSTNFEGYLNEDDTVNNISSWNPMNPSGSRYTEEELNNLNLQF